MKRLFIVCDHCDKTFTDLGFLNNHIITSYCCGFILYIIGKPTVSKQKLSKNKLLFHYMTNIKNFNQSIEIKNSKSWKHLKIN